MADLDQRIRYLNDRYPGWIRRTISGHFDRAVELYADKAFICTPDGESTYAEIQKSSQLVAKGLLSLGIRPREHVAMLVGNYPEFVILKLALSRIGAVAVPLNMLLTEREISFLLEDSDAVAVVFNDHLGRQDYIKIVNSLFPEVLRRDQTGSVSVNSRFPKIRNLICFSPAGESYPGLMSFESLYNLAASVPDRELWKAQAANCYPDDIFDILYTSGTTAMPKGAMLSHDMCLRSVYAYCVTRSIKNGTRTYSPLPFYHIFAWNYVILAASFVGGTVITHPQFLIDQSFELMVKYRANEIVCVPSMLLALINYPGIGSFDLKHLTSVFCGASTAPLLLWRKAKEAFKLDNLAVGYGLTESGGAVTISYPGESEEMVSTRVGRMMVPNCSGLPEFGWRNQQLKVVDPVSLQEFPRGVEGELVCRGNVVIRGYYKRPEINEETIDKDGWLRTGDLVIWHEDGSFQFMGRSKEIYKTSGENVVPKEIEDVLSLYPKINQVYLVGIPHPVMGDLGAAFIELKPGEKATRMEIIKYCKKNMAKFKIPRYVFFVDAGELPFTASGKIKKYELIEYAKQLLMKNEQTESE
jgi:fatty-acyl-CoA synthase